MPFREPRFIALSLLFLVAVATSPFGLAHALPMIDEPENPPVGPPAISATRQSDPHPDPAPGRMFVEGRVLDPEGKPVPGAMIVVHARDLSSVRPPYVSYEVPLPIGTARADGSGRFRLDAPRTSSSRHDLFGAVALAPGHGVGWAELHPDDDQPTAEISLRPERVIHGRLLDPQGRPVPDVTLSVWSIRRDVPQAPAGVRSRFDGVYYGWTAMNDYPGWPRPVKTDSEGRFTLHGVGRDMHAILTVHHPRFALQRIQVSPSVASESKPLTTSLAPTQIITGRVTYADTGKPAPHARLRVMAIQGNLGIPAGFETDAEGRFRINPAPSDRTYLICAYPPEGQPYLAVEARLAWPRGALEQTLDLTLPRGVLIRGKVTEKDTGKPISGATVDFVSRAEKRKEQGVGYTVMTASNGSFLLGGVPEPGILFIKAPTDDYVLEAIGHQMVVDGQPGGGRVYADALTGLDLKPGIDPPEIHLALRRGVTVTGQVVGPDNQPVQDARLISRIIFAPSPLIWRTWSRAIQGHARGGRFVLHRLDPNVETPVSFLDPGRKLGATVNLSGKSIALMTLASRTGRVAPGATISFSNRSMVRGPITVRLEPCGAARARLVDPEGEPVAGRLPRGFSITMVVTPGSPRGVASEKAGILLADEAELSRVDAINYANGLVSDAQGRVTLPVLIPGATYRFIDSTRGREADPQVRKEFTVKPGETLDLGDILVQKPGK